MNLNFSNLISQITQTNERLQHQAAKSIDRFLTLRNWLIGAYIVEYEQKGADKAVYGSKLEERLAEEINQKGLSARNLKLFKQFYNTYPQIVQTVSALSEIPKETMQTLSALLAEKENSEQSTDYINPVKLLDSLSFSHFVELIKIEEISKRQFYEIQIIQSALSVRELKVQINKLSYERTVSAADKVSLNTELHSKAETQNATGLLKTPYVFDFLGWPDEVLASESKLEDALIRDLKNFMLELGHGFCFEAQQKRIVIGGEYYFVDLVFYHRVLKCHVLIELKVDTFKHEHAGQLNTYLQYYKSNVREKEDNPPIGILLCTNQNTELVKYALGGMDKNLFVSEYKTALPSQEELTAFLQKEKKKLEN